MAKAGASKKQQSTKGKASTRKKKALPAGMTMEQMIRTRAFELYEAREGGAGDETSDWMQAEREMREANEE